MANKLLITYLLMTYIDFGMMGLKEKNCTTQLFNRPQKNP